MVDVEKAEAGFRRGVEASGVLHGPVADPDLTLADLARKKPCAHDPLFGREASEEFRKPENLCFALSRGPEGFGSGHELGEQHGG